MLPALLMMLDWAAGDGSVVTDIRGWVTMRSHLPQDVTLTDTVVTKLSLKSQVVTSIGGTDG